MTNAMLTSLVSPLIAAHELAISAMVTSPTLDPESRAYFERALRGAIQNIAANAGYKLVPIVTIEDERKVA